MSGPSKRKFTLKLYTQSNKIHKVFYDWVLFITYVSSIYFEPHRSIFRSVCLEALCADLVCGNTRIFRKQSDNIPFMRHEKNRKLPNSFLDYGTIRFTFIWNQKISTDEIHCVKDRLHWLLNLHYTHRARKNKKTYRIYRPQAEYFLTKASLKTKVGTADTSSEILKAFLLLWWVKKVAAIVMPSRCSRYWMKPSTSLTTSFWTNGPC